MKIKRLLGAFLFLCVAETLVADETPELFLNATLDAISTAAGNLRTGEMEFDYRSTANTIDSQRQRPGVTKRSVAGRVLWKDDSWYADYTFDEQHTASLGEVDEEVFRPAWNGSTEVIRTPQRFCHYVKESEWCKHQTTNLAGSMLGPYDQIFSPQQAWFTLFSGSRRTNHIGNLETMQQVQDRSLITVTPVEDSPRRMQILRTDKDETFSTGFIVDLDQGGQVVESWFRPAESHWDHATWAWSRDQHGVRYVTNWKHTRTDENDHDKIRFVEQMSVSNFTSRPEIPRNRFEFASLKLPKGTRVQTISARGSSYSRVGGEASAKKFDLDSLIDDAQDGFAGPSPKEP